MQAAHSSPALWRLALLHRGAIRAATLEARRTPIVVGPSPTARFVVPASISVKAITFLVPSATGYRLNVEEGMGGSVWLSGVRTEVSALRGSCELGPRDYGIVTFGELALFFQQAPFSPQEPTSDAGPSPSALAHVALGTLLLLTLSDRQPALFARGRSSAPTTDVPTLAPEPTWASEPTLTAEPTWAPEPRASAQERPRVHPECSAQRSVGITPAAAIRAALDAPSVDAMLADLDASTVIFGGPRAGARTRGSHTGEARLGTPRVDTGPVVRRRSARVGSERGVVAPEPPLPDEGLTGDQIMRVVRRNGGSLRACYLSALRREEGVRGRMVLAIRVDTRGDVESVRITESSLGSPTLSGCILRRVRTWHFPEPASSLSTSMSLPLAFD